MSKNTPNTTFKDGSPAPFVQPGEPVIKLFPGVPPLGSDEFKTYLADWHAKHNGNDKPIPFRLTEKGKRTVEVA